MDILVIFKHALMISVFVFVMMLLVDFIETSSKQKLSIMIQGGRWRQYTIASFLGSTPGCLGAFMNVSLYVHGMISFGAIVGGMIATSGDEAFIMLAEFPGKAMLLFVLLFICGILFAGLADRLIGLFKIAPCESCQSTVCEKCLAGEQHAEKISAMLSATQGLKNLQRLTPTRSALLFLLSILLVLIIHGVLGPDNWGLKRITLVILAIIPIYFVMVASEHYLFSHVWEHIIKGHLLQVFLWSFGALMFVHLGLTHWDLNAFIQQHMLWIILIGACIGLIPESGPHLMIVMMYVQGIVPFSVLFTASFVQDGHGMLPMLSYSIKDSLLIKLFNLLFGVLVGGILYFLGI
jgi:hypothetical protein